MPSSHFVTRCHFLAYERDDYNAADTDVWGILNPAYQTLQKRAWSIMREAEQGQRLACAEQSSADYDDMHGALVEVLADYLQSIVVLTPYATTNPAGHTPHA